MAEGTVDAGAGVLVGWADGAGGEEHAARLSIAARTANDDRPCMTLILLPWVPGSARSQPVRRRDAADERHRNRLDLQNRRIDIHEH